MTLDEIKGCDSPVLTPAQAASAIGMDPNTLRWQAQRYPEKLGFPVIVAKSRVKIPRIPFLQYVYGSAAVRETDNDVCLISDQ